MESDIDVHATGSTWHHDVGEVLLTEIETGDGLEYFYEDLGLEVQELDEFMEAILQF